ncbi:MAG: NADPH-dependent FMN reductase [Leucobacter sp.]|jgi:NAD(P)H-dependent FMN reductase
MTAGEGRLPRIGIVIGSIRRGRKGGGVGAWVEGIASRREDLRASVLDVETYDLPLLTEETLPAAADREYESEKVRRWSRDVDSCDGYVFVTPEYNHGVPGAFKNAVDCLAPEWTGKPIGFVSYGSESGVRAVEQWRQIVANFEMVDVRAQVSMSTFAEFEEDGAFAPSDRREGELGRLLDQLVRRVGEQIGKDS